ncbi:glucokinase regulator family [Niveomyces insectorum RCEF 264]|uniref:N-acetyl-D-glucosamine kinase n=1 Tax=Niveomyces insectorum RCEF 264 TaxID=1081102 RepID=A0A167LWE8_9HYPO|nr:glucokinase regulator family [Niveomyces insectorum RCEF 264]
MQQHTPSPASAKTAAVQNGTVSRPQYFLCVDGGGSSCTAALISSSGTFSIGEAGPCNPSTIGITAAISTISSAINAAVSRHAETNSDTVADVPIASAWVGLAGYDRPSLAPQIDAAVAQLLGLPLGPRLTMSTDIDLLSVNAARRQPSVDAAVVLVAGTGSVAMSYVRQGSGTAFARSGRIGGWGPLLGDEGSGFAIGREALRVALRASDSMMGVSSGPPEANGTAAALTQAVFEFYGRETPGAFDPRDLLSAILAPPATTGKGAAAQGLSPTKSIARVAQLVLSLSAADDQAKAILERGARHLAEMVVELLKLQNIRPAKAAFIMAGGVLCSSVYNSMVQKELLERGIEFQWTTKVDAPALEGARYLAGNGIGE